MKENKIIITGGGGFVGRNLIRVMIKEGFKPENIVVIDKDNLNFIKKYKVKIIFADLSEKGKWMNEFKNTDVVINLAAQISSPDYEPFKKNNIESTKNIIEAMKKFKVKKILHFSSAAVLSVRKDFYAETKKEGEKLVINSGLNYCILRPSLMYGPTDDKNVGYLINFARKFHFLPIPGNGKSPRQPIYIDDICRLVIKILNNFPKNKIINVNGKEIIYFRDMVKIILKEIGGFKFRLFFPVKLFKIAMILYQKIIGENKFTTDQVDSLTSGDVFEIYPWWEEYNIKTTSFEEGVRKMI
mgnify:FL=1